MSAFAGRDGDQVDAMTTDRYLDALLSAHAIGAERIPASSRLDPAARRAADRLARELPRLHPSFRFEDGLWLRLAEVARGMRLGVTAGPDGLPIRVIGPVHGRSEMVDLQALAALVDGPDPAHDLPVAVRPLLVGGALTSAALSLAGAAYVAWRLSRPGAAPMARAIRAVNRTRLA
jgi:hypothetical protein